MIESDISFKGYKKTEDIHGIALYPAMMAAPSQKVIMDELIRKSNIKSVFDPFVGSGTTLFEAKEVSPEIRAVGCDINPLAYLITKVKLQGVSSNLDMEIDRVEAFANGLVDVECHSFDNIEKWFRKDIINSLSVLRTSIMMVEDDRDRMFFWCVLTNIVRKYSNTRSSTYKLHIKDSAQIDRLENNVIRDYFRLLRLCSGKFKKTFSNYVLYKCDSVKKMKDFCDKEFDMTITSPPYGDNGTTVPYGQFSSLQLRWIDSRDLELEGWEMENYSSIDRKSLGGSQTRGLTVDEVSILEPYLSKIDVKKHAKVKRFFADYFDAMGEIARVTKTHIAITLGNRTVDRVKIDLVDVTKTFFESKGFSVSDELNREIPSKRIPSKTSSVRSKPVESITKEVIVIFSNLNS